MIKEYIFTENTRRELDEERTTINERVRYLEDKVEELLRIQIRTDERKQETLQAGYIHDEIDYLRGKVEELLLESFRRDKLL